MRNHKRLCINKIIEALKNEIENNDISKHIEIINYMHKTEVEHIHKRHEQVLEDKNANLIQIEGKLSEFKAKNKELETHCIQKEAEFEWYRQEQKVKV